MGKIYTKKGDDGTTSLIGGKRVSKSDARIEAYGTVDELIAYAGLLRDMLADEKIRQVILQIQDRLMVCAAILASDCDNCEVKLPEIQEKDIVFLENEMDRLSENLPLLNSFVLPGGHPVVSYCHIARTVCRRAERRVIELNETGFVPQRTIKYINRLSDYLFVLSRYLSVDLQIHEIKWIPKGD